MRAFSPARWAGSSCGRLRWCFTLSATSAPSRCALCERSPASLHAWLPRTLWQVFPQLQVYTHIYDSQLQVYTHIYDWMTVRCTFPAHRPWDTGCGHASAADVKASMYRDVGAAPLMRACARLPLRCRAAVYCGTSTACLRTLEDLKLRSWVVCGAGRAAPLRGGHGGQYRRARALEAPWLLRD